MASFTKNFSFIFFLTLISSLQIHARNNQFFNKIPSHNVNVVKKAQVVIPNKEQFLPENDNNGYGLYGHESGQLPPSTTTTTTNAEEPYKTTPANNISESKYLPKNYNPVAYVTVPENNDDNNNNNEKYNNSVSTYNNNNKNEEYYNADSANNNNEEYYKSDSTSNNNNNEEYYNAGSTNNNNEEYYNGDSTYNNNNKQQELIWDKSDTATPTTTYPTSTNNYYNKNDGNNYYNNQESSNPTNYNQYNVGGNGNRVQQQGTSDTRFLENGKYFYDVNTEKYAKDPYENSREYNNDQFKNNFVENNNQNEEELQFDDDEEEKP